MVPMPYFLLIASMIIVVEYLRTYGKGNGSRSTEAGRAPEAAAKPSERAGRPSKSSHMALFPEPSGPGVMYKTNDSREKRVSKYEPGGSIS